MLSRADTLLNELLGIGPTKRDTIHEPKPIVRKHPEPKIYFDADRFRWFFKNRDGRTLQQWRDQIDQEMRDEEAGRSAVNQADHRP